MREFYPDDLPNDINSLLEALSKINNATGNKFVVIIDEWDVLIRDEAANKKVQEKYINFLRAMFKGTEPTKYIRLVYLTGILPIKKEKTQSALNNFDEFIGVLRDEKLDPREGLRIYTRSISDIFHKYPPAYVKLIYREVIKPSQVFQDVVLNKFKSNSAVLLKMIERGKEQGIFLKTLDEKTVLLMLISIINLYFLTKPLHSMVIEQDESFTESYLRQVLDILLRGIEVKGHDKT